MISVDQVLVRGVGAVLREIIDASEQRARFGRRDLLEPVEMPVKLVASDVADERGMMTRVVRGRCRLMTERRDVMPGERMADRLAAVVQEQRTVSHLRERDEHYGVAPLNVSIGRPTN